MDNVPFVGKQLLLLTFSLSLGIFMNVLDSSIANVAVPYIAGDLAVSANQGTWVITSFTVSSAIMLPLTGWLSKQLGEVRLFVWATFLFTVFSFLCGFSRSLPELIVFRVLQGAVAGPMIPLSQSLLLANYPPEKKGLANSLWSMTAVVAPLCGPILGGWLTYNYSWPWIFYINVPVGLFSAYFTYRMLKDRDTPVVKLPIDKVGLILLALAVGCLQVLLDNGQDDDWFNSNFIVTLGIISLISTVFFLIWELTDKQPIVELSLFKNRNFAVGSIVLACGYMIFFSIIVIFPLWLQTQLGYTATWAGLAAAPIGILPILLTPFLGKSMHRLNLRVVVSFGFSMFALSSLWSAFFYSDVSFWNLVVPRVIMGLGIACFFAPLLSIITLSLPADKLASGLGLTNFLRIIGGSFGVSLSVALWQRREAFHQSRLVEQINAYNHTSIQYLHQLQQLGLTHGMSLQYTYNVVIAQSFMLATNDFFWLCGWIFVALIVVIWFAKKPEFVGPAEPIAMH